MKPYLSLVIPAYNEEKRLSKTLDVIREFFSAKGYSYEVLIVNDGSRDGTEDAVRKRQKTWPELKLLSERVNHGKGYSVKKGMLSASGQYVIFSDADISTPLTELDALLSKLIEGQDMVVGSRYIRMKGGAQGRVTQTALRHFAGKLFSFIVRVLVSSSVLDTQCGFKGFTGKSARSLFSRQKLNGFAFDVEILYLAAKLGLKVLEVPVEWREDPDSKISLWKDSFQMLYDVLKIRALHFREDYSTDSVTE